MFVIKILTFGFILFFLSSCNKNMSDDQKKEMWSKAQTTGEIYKRSGSKLPNSTANQKAKAMRDAETRLVTGGGLFGKDGLDFYRKLFNLARVNSNIQLVCVECGINQAEDIKLLAKLSGFKCFKCVQDYQEIERVLIFKK